MSAPSLHPAVVEYEEGRAGRQRVAFAVFLLLFIALTAFGIWVIVASQQQYPGRAEAWVGTAFGAMFAILGLAVSITAVEVLIKVRRLSAKGVLLQADTQGVSLAADATVPWASIDRIEARADAPASHRTNRVAGLDPGHRVGLATRLSLDRLVGVPFGVRDGKRAVRVVLDDGTDRVVDLTLPVGPARFEAVVTALGEHAAHHDVGFFSPR